jgi:hypothetical protein
VDREGWNECFENIFDSLPPQKESNKGDRTNKIKMPKTLGTKILNTEWIPTKIKRTGVK